jgi:hypothetical protein
MRQPAAKKRFIAVLYQQDFRVRAQNKLEKSAGMGGNGMPILKIPW